MDDVRTLIEEIKGQINDDDAEVDDIVDNEDAIIAQIAEPSVDDPIDTPINEPVVNNPIIASVIDSPINGPEPPPMINDKPDWQFDDPFDPYVVPKSMSMFQSFPYTADRATTPSSM